MGKSIWIFIMMSDDAMWYSHNDVLNGPIRKFTASIDTDSRAKLRNAWINDKDRICDGIIHNIKKWRQDKNVDCVGQKHQRGRSRSNDKTICVKLVKLKNNWDGERMKMTILKSNSLRNHRKLFFGRLRSPWMCVRFTVYAFDEKPNLNTTEAAVEDCASTDIVLHKVWWARFKRLPITRADANRQTV